MGRESAYNPLPIEALRQGIRLTGYAGLPTLNRGNAQHQYLFVNGRPVRDKLLYGAIRGAYQDFLARDRHPLVALFVELPPEEVDVNVHPAKRSEEHTSELQSLMRISYAVFCLKKKKKQQTKQTKKRIRSKYISNAT